ncbi:MAG TPA: flagellar filament capping protein FliD, partial [Spirochaetia bacterium]|nr:flagellar filament capping protein FliD [Spirochaetia bacterium]
SLTMDGVQVHRPSNTVDDLLPGVTLTLKTPAATPTTITVKHDVEGIKRQIVSLVGAYNQIITNVDVLTRKDQSIIDNTQWDSDDAKKKAQESLGLLTGEITLQQIKSSLQLTMMGPYPTSLDRDMRLLAQIGISTDARPPGSGGIDKTRLRGYLEIDDAKLTAALQDHADAVKQLFGNDTDGDLVVDSGVAFKLDALLRPYVQTGGILALRVSGLDSRIAQTKKDITDLKAALDDKQAELKQKYAQMAGALDDLNKNSQDITNFNRQQGSGQSGQ